MGHRNSPEGKDDHLGEAVALRFNADDIHSWFLMLDLVTTRTWCNKMAMDKLNLFCHKTKPEVKNLRKGRVSKGKDYRGGRDIREAREESSKNALGTCLKFPLKLT